MPASVTGYYPVEFHKCTEEDYAEFYPVSTSSASLLKNLKYMGLYCIDLDENLSIGGDWTSGEYNVDLAVIISPCRKSELPDCTSDFAKQKEYIGDFAHLNWYSNYDRLDRQAYGDDVVRKESKVESR